MATGSAQPASPHAALQQFPRSTPQQPPTAPSPPSRRDLASWWKQFKRNARKEEEKAVQNPGIFGVPLNVSIKYANVAISLTDENGESFIYGYVPIVVAKCGVYLKEKATDVEGIFRLSGSAKRIKDLQEIFDSPDRYGKGLDWTGYTVHDAANILRRYLNQLPEPIVPLNFYERFRDPLRRHQAQAVGDTEAQAEQAGDFDHQAAVITYQKLIKELPSLNRQLLLYILDLLAVFSSKSEQNRMTSANLAAIFQPGLLSHPSHDMVPQEYRLSQDVLIFLIENQDNFLFGMTGTAADEQTMKEVESGGAPPTTHRPSSSAPRRSASNASAGADSLRKYENLRRNVSVSSKNSRHSGNAPSPGTPSSLGGVHRSNTVPSKKSPALNSTRFVKPKDASSSTPSGLTPPAQSYGASEPGSRTPSTHSNSRVARPQVPETGSLASTPVSAYGPGPNSTSTDPNDRLTAPKLAAPEDSIAGTGSPPNSVTPTKDRKLSSFFSKSPPLSGEAREARPPNRLRKKRIPGSASVSAASSTNSLSAASLGEGAAAGGPQTPRATWEPGNGAHPEASHMVTPTLANTAATPVDENPPELKALSQPGEAGHAHSNSEHTLKPARPRTPSISSRSSVTDHSELDQADDTSKSAKKDHRRSWRFHRSRRSDEHMGLGVSSPPHHGANTGADLSTSSIGSLSKMQKSDSSTTGPPSTLPSGAPESEGAVRDPPVSPEPEKKSLFGKFKAKVAQVKEGVKEREAERERAKSPPRSGSEREASAHSLAQMVTDAPGNGRRTSQDRPRQNSATSETAEPTAVSASSPPPAIPEEPSPAEPTTTTTDAEGPATSAEETPTNKTPTAEGQPPGESIPAPAEEASSVPPPQSSN